MRSDCKETTKARGLNRFGNHKRYLSRGRQFTGRLCLLELYKTGKFRANYRQKDYLNRVVKVWSCSAVGLRQKGVRSSSERKEEKGWKAW